MTESGDLEARVSALEGDMGELKRRVERSEHDAAAARVLAGGADRDVEEMRAEIREFRDQNNRLHNATRADIVDIRSEIANMKATMHDGFAEMRGKFDVMAAGQQQIVNLLNRVIDQRE